MSRYWINTFCLLQNLKKAALITNCIHGWRRAGGGVKNQEILPLFFMNGPMMCGLWQYELPSSHVGGIKLERFSPKNQHTQRKLLNF